MSIDFSKLHFNSILLVQELISRGVNVRLIEGTGLVEARLGEHFEIMDDTDLSLMPSTYRYIFDDKWKTKKVLEEKGFSIIEGAVFDGTDIESAAEYASSIGFPVVIKPRSGTHGYYVRMNIDSRAEFEEIFEKLSKEAHGMDLLVEKQVDGNEYRLTVTRNGFFGAVHRNYPRVTGDGRSTITELVDTINTVRVDERMNCLCRIWLDSEARRYLSKKGLTVNYIPQEGEEVVLRSNSNVSTGAECIDMTAYVSPKFQEIARNLLDSFPGLPYIGIDFITRDITTEGVYTICELNPAPGISLHTHPSSGVGRDLPRYIIDMLFPETMTKILQGELASKHHASIGELNDEFKSKYPKSYFYQPVHLELELTHKCNLLCSDCTIKTDVINGEFGLANDKIVSVLQEASNLGFYSYSLTGGEPFMRFDDMCHAMKATPGLDCYKIQTNGVFFSSEDSTKKTLLRLRDSGFGAVNQYVKSSLRCSVGIQDTNQKVSLQRVKNLVSHFYTVFDRDLADLALVLTHDPEKSETEAIMEFREKYRKEMRESLPSDIAIRPIFIHKRDWIRTSGKKSKILPLLERSEYGRNCFSYDTLPWTRLLVRAQGDVYSCSCFGHNFKLGNVKTESLETMIEAANKDKTLGVIGQGGVIGLYERIKAIYPEVEAFELDESTSLCDICKILKNRYPLP